MIVLNLQKIKKKFTKIINEYENLLNYGNLECPYCHSNQYIRWGFYERNIIFVEENQIQTKILKIQRIKCKSCEKTHALMPDGIIPYKQYNLSFIIECLIEYKQKKKLYMNIELDIIKKWYKQFKNKCLPYVKTTFPDYTILEILKNIKDKVEARKKYMIKNQKYFMQIKLLYINYAPS